MRDQATLHLPDWSSIALPPHEQMLYDKVGIRSGLLLPMLQNGQCLGVLNMVRMRPGAFSAQEIELAESFRDQAMIAIENTRLFRCDQRSAGAPDRDGRDPEGHCAIARRCATRVRCDRRQFEPAIGVTSTMVARITDDVLHLVAFTATDPAGDAALKASFSSATDPLASLEALRDGELVQVLDAESDMEQARGCATWRVPEVGAVPCSAP